MSAWEIFSFVYFSFLPGKIETGEMQPFVTPKWLPYTSLVALMCLLCVNLKGFIDFALSVSLVYNFYCYFNIRFTVYGIVCTIDEGL